MQKMRIAIVDDSDSFLLVAQGQITEKMELQPRKISFEVHTFNDPVEFVDKYKRHSYQIVIVDQSMPALKGTQVISNLSQLQPSSRFILATAKSSNQELGEVFMNPQVVGVYEKNEHLYQNIVNVLPLIYDMQVLEDKSETRLHLLQLCLAMLILIAIFLVNFVVG